MDKFDEQAREIMLMEDDTSSEGTPFGKRVAALAQALRAAHEAGRREAISAASDLWRQKAVILWGNAAAKGDIPSAQVPMLADMETEQFARALSNGGE